jgi:hypothetical protein
LTFSGIIAEDGNVHRGAQRENVVGVLEQNGRHCRDFPHKLGMVVPDVSNKLVHVDLPVVPELGVARREGAERDAGWIDGRIVLILAKVIIRRHDLGGHIIKAALVYRCVVDHRRDVTAEESSKLIKLWKTNVTVSNPSRHIEIQAGLNRSHTGMSAVPIRYHIALKAQLAFQYAVKKLRVLASVRSVAIGRRWILEDGSSAESGDCSDST